MGDGMQEPKLKGPAPWTPLNATVVVAIEATWSRNFNAETVRPVSWGRATLEQDRPQECFLKSFSLIDDHLVDNSLLFNVGKKENNRFFISPRMLAGRNMRGVNSNLGA
jgi:hypothetical protein